MNTIMPQHPRRGKISTPNEYSGRNINNQRSQVDREKLEKCILAALRILRENPASTVRLLPTPEVSE